MTLALAVSACWTSVHAAECTEPTPECVAALKAHAVRFEDYWKSALALPFEQRIGPAPAEVVDYITRDNIMRGFPNRPKVSGLPPEFRADVEQAFREIPEPVRRRIENKLAGIYFTVDLGGTGFTEAITSADGSERTGFIVLDSTVLGLRKANAWAAWKENSPFAPEPGYRLAAEIEEPANDNRRNAIQYILLHELGHVLSIGEQIHPPWTVLPQHVAATAGLEYFALSWAPPNGAERYASLFDERFPQREHVMYYFGANLMLSQAAVVYEELRATNFPTLYAATSPGDDWAEGFASYIHTVMMGKPFRIRIYQAGQLVEDYGPCWEEPRCAGKRRIIEKFLRMSSTQP